MTEQQVVRYSTTEAEIAKLGAIYMDLVITDLSDTEQLDAVSTARKTMKTHRVAVQNEEKNLKADANVWRKKVGARAKEIYAAIAPIENHLIAEEQKVKAEANRIKAEENAKRVEETRTRVKLLAGVGKTAFENDVAMMTDFEFDTALFDATEEWKVEQERLAQEEADRKAEAENQEKIRLDNESEAKRLADIAAEQKATQDAVDAQRIKENDRIAEEQRVAQQKINADRKALEDEKARIAKVEQDKKDAEAKTLQDAADLKAENERLAQEQIDRDEARAKDRERQERLAPDKETLEMAISACNPIQSEPELKSPEAIELWECFLSELETLVDAYIDKVESI